MSLTIYDKIKYMLSKPTVRNKVHESMYRSYDVVAIICEMLEKDYPKSAIKELIDYYYTSEQKEDNNND